MIVRLTRSAALAVVLTVGAALAYPANAMPLNGTLTDSASPIAQVGLKCTRVCIKQKPTVGGLNCLQYGTVCSMTPQLGRHTPPPAKMTPH
jgi:hypothetical protein